MPRYKLRTLMIVLALGPMGLAYVGGYFWLGNKGMVGDGVTVLRIYDSKYLAGLFVPAAMVESVVTGCDVIATRYADENED